MQVNSNIIAPASQDYLNHETSPKQTDNHLGHTWTHEQAITNNTQINIDEVAQEVLENHSLNNNNSPISLKKNYIASPNPNHVSSSEKRNNEESNSNQTEINNPNIPEAVAIDVDVPPVNPENPTSQSLPPIIATLNPLTSNQLLQSQIQRTQPTTIHETNGKTYNFTISCFSGNATNLSQGFGHYLIPATVIAGVAGIVGAVLIANATNEDERLAGRILTPVGFVGLVVGGVSAFLRAAARD